MYQLTSKALRLINTPETRRKLAAALNCTEQSIIRYISTNDDNLTKWAAIEVIKKATRLSNAEVLARVRSVAA